MISVHNLSFTYPKSNVEAVKNISFDVQDGEIFGFLGPSGAGKSTTQKLLIKLLQGFQGDVTVLKRKLSSWNGDYFANIGVGFELPNHYLKLTGEENLKLFSSFYPKVVYKPVELLRMVELEEHAKKPVESYSKGMKMRLNFVRSLMHDPKLLFLDEPTSGLDPGYARMIKDIIIDLKKRGKTIFLTTHNMHDADELCDRVAFMVDGELKLIGSPRELKLQNGKRRVKIETRVDEKLVTQEFEFSGLPQNSDFLESISNPNLQSIHSCEESLEEVFLRTTGKSLKVNG
ncbi:MAG: ABC transporter ATP-binding protein [Tenuifilaceae bacterium]|jgi:fluoroquinolone transport system ATP-binding protein|nr:ABC transporter ATP-binding protein [Tenuifilaceae bacterium]